MDENEQFFVSESIRHAKSLPFSDCINYLFGLMSAIQESHPAASALRSIYRSLVDSDQQLDLIQVGQLKLKLVSAQVRPRGKSDRPARTS